MSRAIKMRTSSSGYAADVTTLGRMSVAIKLDRRIDKMTAKKLIGLLDALMSELASLTQTLSEGGS